MIFLRYFCFFTFRSRFSLKSY